MIMDVAALSDRSVRMNEAKAARLRLCLLFGKNSLFAIELILVMNQSHCPSSFGKWNYSILFSF